MMMMMMMMGEDMFCLQRFLYKTMQCRCVFPFRYLHPTSASLKRNKSSTETQFDIYPALNIDKLASCIASMLQSPCSWHSLCLP